MLVHCLLAHCKYHHDDVVTLFQLLRVYITRHIKSFHFLTSYLENDVAKLYSIPEKRAVFFKFVELFTDAEFPQELKGKVSIYTVLHNKDLWYYRQMCNSVAYIELLCLETNFLISQYLAMIRLWCWL